jgi:hypothetical protein
MEENEKLHKIRAEVEKAKQENSRRRGCASEQKIG